MKLTWFVHEPLDTDTANELLSRYAARKIQTTKTLAADPRYWLVSALLPESNHIPQPSKRWEQPTWGRI